MRGCSSACPDPAQDVTVVMRGDAIIDVGECRAELERQCANVKVDVSRLMRAQSAPGSPTDVGVA
jgi:hypothetical protein